MSNLTVQISFFFLRTHSSFRLFHPYNRTPLLRSRVYSFLEDKSGDTVCELKTFPLFPQGEKGVLVGVLPPFLSGKKGVLVCVLPHFFSGKKGH